MTTPSIVTSVALLAPTPEERHLWRWLEDHGVQIFAWPTGARLHWSRENGIYSWSDGSFSPDKEGNVPQ